MDKKPTTVQEAGRKGGSVVRDKYGSEFYSEQGKKGGARSSLLAKLIRRVAKVADLYLQGKATRGALEQTVRDLYMEFPKCQL